MNGEFEKRIEEENYEYYVPETPDKVRVVRVKKIHKIVDEARKDHPRQIVINAYNASTRDRLISKLQEMWSWYEKWFGDQP